MLLLRTVSLDCWVGTEVEGWVSWLAQNPLLATEWGLVFNLVVEFQGSMEESRQQMCGGA